MQANRRTTERGQDCVRGMDRCRPRAGRRCGGVISASRTRNSSPPCRLTVFVSRTIEAWPAVRHSNVWLSQPPTCQQCTEHELRVGFQKLARNTGGQAASCDADLPHRLRQNLAHGGDLCVQAAELARRRLYPCAGGGHGRSVRAPVPGARHGPGSRIVASRVIAGRHVRPAHDGGPRAVEVSQSRRHHGSLSEGARYFRLQPPGRPPCRCST